MNEMAGLNGVTRDEWTEIHRQGGHREVLIDRYDEDEFGYRVADCPLCAEHRTKIEDVIRELVALADSYDGWDEDAWNLIVMWGNDEPESGEVYRTGDPQLDAKIEGIVGDLMVDEITTVMDDVADTANE